MNPSLYRTGGAWKRSTSAAKEALNYLSMTEYMAHKITDRTEIIYYGRFSSLAEGKSELFVFQTELFPNDTIIYILYSVLYSPL